LQYCLTPGFHHVVWCHFESRNFLSTS
jgi:hypothetical protein